MNFEDIGLQIADIWLPNASIDPKAWAVIACDQYSSQPDYWQRVAHTCDGKPSTLALIYPEVFLEANDKDARITAIHDSMRRYLDQGVLQQYPETLIICERQLQNGALRRGVLVALDLEHYSYQRGANTLIRSTEGTIVERLPPRVAIREQAPLESPHIMVLIDDPAKTVVEPLFQADRRPLYDTPLMLDAGHLKGWAIQDEAAITRFAAGLRQLADPRHFQEKYQTPPEEAPLLYAMGDGNHSFATAKAIWESLKQQLGLAAVAQHPARYALVELVNLYDDSLQFEPIHRVLFNVNVTELLQALGVAYPGTKIIAADASHECAKDSHCLPFVSATHSGVVEVPQPGAQLAAGTLQQFLDDYLTAHPDVSIDYIHGTNTTRELGTLDNNIGFLLPAIDKHSLFKTVIFDGALPRKTFSMGEAVDKRFYFECRQIQE